MSTFLSTKSAATTSMTGQQDGLTTTATVAAKSVVLTNQSLLECESTGATDAYYGRKLASSLENLLHKIKEQGLEVSPKDRDRLSNKCFAPGNPEPEFTDPNAASTQSFQYLSSLVEGLRADPRGRSHVVDHYPAPHTEDSFWLSLPKWQKQVMDQHGNGGHHHGIDWSVVTVRSIDRPTFRECFHDWDVKHVHGTAMVTSCSDESSSRHGGVRTRALFSDQPCMVDYHGQSMGNDPDSELVVRVFRCAPLPCLKQGIAAVLSQDCPPTVFDLWIRHHEVPDHVEEFRHFQHSLGSDVTLLELLTDIDYTPSLLQLLPSTPPQPVHQNQYLSEVAEVKC
jgi:hypothetical protein